MKRFACLQIILVFTLLFTACKSKPAVPEEEAAQSPSATLTFTGIQADDVEHLIVSSILQVKAPSDSRAKIDSWRILIDEQDAGFAFSLNYPQGEFPTVSPVPLTLNMDISALAAKGLAPKDEYAVTLIAELDVFSGQASHEKITLRETANFPGVREPGFSITSIAILKAELINTRFRVNIKIDNPNSFPLELSGFIYELYGNGRLWADGTEKNVFVVDSKSSMQGELYLIMNFINMERSLLNQIINLVDVNYRFTGEAQVSTGIDYLPKFRTAFDLSGYSKVLEK
jgi:LEA14-like dessication related protein